mgnify:CR=1 FL=1
MRDREEEKEAKKEEAARQRRKKEEEEAVRRMTKEVEMSGCSHVQVRAQLEALEEVLQSLSAEDREVAKLKEARAQLQKAVETRKTAIAALRKEADAHNATIKGLKKDVEKRNATITGLKKDVEARNVTIAGLKKEVAQLKSAPKPAMPISSESLTKMNNCVKTILELSQKGIVSSGIISDAVKSIQRDASNLSFQQNTAFVSKNIIGAAEFIRSKVAEVDSRCIGVVSLIVIAQCVVSGSANAGVTDVPKRESIRETVFGN